MARQRSYTGNNSNRARAYSAPAPKNYATPEEQTAVIQDLRESSGGMLNTIFKTIDTPYAAARALAAGQPSKVFNWNDRVEGIDLLRQYIPQFEEANPYLQSAAGIGLEIALDPFQFFSTPLRAASMAGRASRAVGLGKYAQQAALRKLGGIKSKRLDTLRTAKNAKNYLKGIMRDDRMLTTEMAKQRPMVGPRVSNALVTLEEAINSTPNPSKFKTDVLNFFKKQGVDYDAVKGQKLGGLYGFDPYGMSKNPYVKTLGDLPDNPQAYKFLDSLDAFQEGVRFSKPARVASSLFDKRFRDSDSYGQLKDAQLADAKAARGIKQRQAGAREANKLASIVMPNDVKKALGVDNFLHEDSADFLNRIFENKGTVADQKIYSMMDQQLIDDVYDGWQRNKFQNIELPRMAAGLPKRELKSDFDTEWSPRVAREIDKSLLPGGGGGAFSESLGLSGKTASDIKRKFDTPGGVTDLKQIALIPSVKQMATQGDAFTGNITAVANDIKKFIDAKYGPQTPANIAHLKSLGLNPDPLLNPVQSPIMVKKFDPATGLKFEVPSTTEFINRNDSVNIARTYAAKNRNLPADVPLFSEHPMKTQMRTLEQQGDAIENAIHSQAALGESAIHAGAGNDANMITGTGMVPMRNAVKRITKEVGLNTKIMGPQKRQVMHDTVRDNITRAIAKANPGVDPSKINLNEWSVPNAVIDRIQGAARISKPGQLAAFVENFHKIGEIWKGMLLAFPARHVRDAYANAFQLWLLGGSSDVVFGYRAAKRIFEGNYDAAAELLREIPTYNLSNPGVIKEKLVNDIAGTGILQTLASSDIALMNKPQSYNQIIPGSKPSTINRLGIPQDAIDVFRAQAGRGGIKQQVKDYFTFKDFNPLANKDGMLGGIAPAVGATGKMPSETRNVLLNASQAVNDYVDGVSRLAGQLMLMRRGIPAEEAARRVTEALIDYGGLSSFEKGVMKKVFPWYSYMSRSGAYAVKQLMTKPGGKYAQSLRVFNRAQESDDEVYIPEALRSQFALRIPPEFLEAMGYDPTTNNTFIRDIDIPGYDVLGTFSTKPTMLGSVQNITENLVSQSNPLIQTAAELFTGEDLFSKRPLSQANTGADKAYKYLKARTGIGDPDANLNPLLKQALRLTPGPRITPLIGQLVDPRLPPSQRIPKAMFNALTGVKMQTVDPAYQYGDAREMLSEQLSGVMRDYPMKYVPKDQRDKLTPQQDLQLRVFNTFGKILRDRREARK